MLDKLCAGRFARQESPSPDSHSGEGQVGRDIVKVGNAKARTMIGKIVIGLWLSDARRKRKRYGTTQGDGDQSLSAGSFGNHR